MRACALQGLANGIPIPTRLLADRESALVVVWAGREDRAAMLDRSDLRVAKKPENVWFTAGAR